MLGFVLPKDVRDVLVQGHIFLNCSLTEVCVWSVSVECTCVVCVCVECACGVHLFEVCGVCRLSALRYLRRPPVGYLL